MNTKLTLSINSPIINTIKRDSPIVRELTGIAKVNKNVNRNIDEKHIVAEYLLEKYK